MPRTNSIHIVNYGYLLYLSYNILNSLTWQILDTEPISDYGNVGAASLIVAQN